MIAPYFAADAKGLLKAAIRDPNPVIFLENEIVYGRSFPVPKIDDFVLPIGKARIVRAGKDVTIVAYSICVGLALEAAEKLAARGHRGRGDRPAHPAPAGHGDGAREREEDQPPRHGGTGLAGLLHRLGNLPRRWRCEAFDYLDAPPTKVTGKDVPMPYAANLEKLALPTVEDVIEAVKAVCYKD